MEETYKDDDFVYVDPKTRTVKGIVKWSKHGDAVPLLMEEQEDTEEEEKKDKSSALKLRKPKRRKKRKRYYPWGTYRTMKKLYRLEGKEKEGEKNQAFDEALQRSTREPFWD